MCLQQAAPGNYPACPHQCGGMERIGWREDGRRSGTMANLGLLPGTACCKPTDLLPCKAAPLHRWHAHATAQNRRVQVQRVSNPPSAPSFSPYRIKGRTRPIALVDAHGQPPDQTSLSRSFAAFSVLNQLTHKSSRREFRERSGVLSALWQFARSIRSRGKLVKDRATNLDSFAIRLARDGRQ